MIPEQNIKLCATVGSTKFKDMTRVSMDPKTSSFSCPDTMIACSTNPDLGGTTVCMKNEKDCPVTDLIIFSGDSNSLILSNSL